LGSIIGSIISPLLYNQSPTYALALSAIFTITGLLYTSLFLKETIVIKEVFQKLKLLANLLFIFGSKMKTMKLLISQ